MTIPTKVTVPLIALFLATAGLAAADHEVPPDPFAQEEPLFTDEDEEEAFEDLLDDAPETIPEAGDESDDEDEEDPQPPPEEDTNDAPAPSAFTLLAILGLAAARRCG